MDTSGSLLGICIFLLSLRGFSSSSTALDFCPLNCDCVHSRHLVCANRGLRAVPKAAALMSDDALIFSLGGNFITNISDSDFAQYSKLVRALTTLLLSENEIRHIGNHLFQNLKKLSKLSLSNNRISHMDRDALRGLLSLREFLIDGNELQEISAGWLDPLERVEVLDFSHNRITSVDSLAFSRLKYLKVLRLKNNFLTSLSGEIFAFNNVLQEVDLHGNNWTCDCRLEDFTRWMTAAHSQGKLLTVFVQCHYPESLRGKYLDYVNSSLRLPLGNWNHSCKSGARPEESQAGELLKKLDRKGAELDGEWRGEKDQMEPGEKNKTELGEREGFRQFHRGGIVMRREGEKRKRGGQEEAGIQGDQEGLKAAEPSILKGKKTKKESRPATEAAGKRAKERQRSNVVPKIDPSVTSKPNHPTHTWLITSSPVQSEETFDLLRSDQDAALPVISDPCMFNQHFITNVSVDQVTSSTVTVYWTSRDYHRYTPKPKPGLHEVHYRILFDRFGTPHHFPRYIYAKRDSRSVILRELTSGVTYVVCVEGVVGGSVCQVAPRDHCVGLVTLPEGVSPHGSALLTSDLQLVTVATLVGNAMLLLVISGVWLGRSLRRRLQRRKSAVHVRHMYSTRRPFRPTVASTSVSTDFTSYQSSRPARLTPLEEGDLIEFPCDRFLDNCGVRRDSDMQRFCD
ncbi:hypothetical protein CRENBAI_004827 [Crenichthys baileyi]|uniref:Fibronectin type-III domain-containing protein n=1 Tax=Crenichthys baileyi TaxID=28760 RepID=A0AAV9SM52_9TELE